MWRLGWAAWAVVVVAASVLPSHLFGGPGTAQAQWVGQPDVARRFLPRPLAGPSGALALEMNPAALAFVDGYALTLMHARDSGAQVESLYGVRALPLGLSLAAGADWRRAPGADSGRVSLGGAYAPRADLSIGLAFRYTESPGERAGGLDVGLAYQPIARIGVSVVLRDLLGPLGFTRGNGPVPATAIGAVQLRPFENDALFAEAAVAVNTRGDVGLRGMLGARVPSIGRAQVVLEADDIGGEGDLRVLGSLAFDWGQVSVEGGLLRDGQGDFGEFVAAHYQRAAERGLPEPRYVVDMRLQGGLGPRRLLRVLARLESAARDRSVRGVLLRVGSTGMGLAVAQELRQGIALLEAAGKGTVCLLEAPSGAELYACAGATYIAQDPAGTVRLLGPSTTSLYYGEALRRLGVRTDFVRVGQYKSMVEVYGSDHASEPVRRARGAMMDDAYARLVADMSEDRDVPSETVRGWIDQALFDASSAEEAGLTDGLVDAFEVGPVLQEHLGTARRRERATAEANRSFARGPRVALVVMDGSLVDGDNVDYPIVETHQTGGRTLVRTLEAVRADPSIDAVVLRIDSPGGSALAADQVWRAVRRLREVKPVVASMGAMATSAAYYAASACDVIYADPTTITGSIGVLFGKVDFAPLAEHLGVGIEQEGRGAHAGAESLFRPFSEEEREGIQAQIEHFYQLFLSRVAEGRGMTVEAVHAVAQGRIWTGDAAQRLGLVDSLGGLLSAVHEARRRGGLDADAPMVVAPHRPSSLLEYVVGRNLAGALASESGALGPTHHEQAEVPAIRTTGAGGAFSLSPALRFALDAAAAWAAADGAPMAILPPDLGAVVPR